MKVNVKCVCGKEFITGDWRIKAGRGKFCSKKCHYANMTRPSGLIYQKHKENPTSFKKGNITWNSGLGGTGICKPTSGSMKKGEHRGIATEFKVGQTSGELNNKWKGDEVGYHSLHTWLFRLPYLQG